MINNWQKPGGLWPPGFLYNQIMKNQVILGALALFFALSVIAGLINPREAEELLNESATVLRAEIEETDEAAVLAEEGPVLADASEEPAALSETFYPVERVIDGDTIVVTIDGVNETVRMIGVDTPETVHPSKPVECFGREASARAKEWLEGREVKLVIDDSQGKHDKYRRLLAYVYRDDGLFVNKELIAQGYAYEYKYNAPYTHEQEFKQAEEAARLNGLGLWGEDSACGSSS